jgi:L,D-transpeptidase ErfK/SrfK
MYGIHGTNIPWGVGMQVSHGCVRLYPEDIERLFPLVPIGAPGEFTYQSVKAGMRDGAVYLEAHSDIYGSAPAPYREAMAALGRVGLADRVDEHALLRALQDQGGMPVRLTPEPSEPGVVPASADVHVEAQHDSGDGGIPPQDNGKAADD